MNDEIIFQMITPYVKNYAITYDEFNNLFSCLNKKEQYEITNLLWESNIELIDEHQDPENNKDFEILYDENIFKDTDSEDEILITNKNISQTNTNLCALIQDGNSQAKQDLCIKNKKLVDKFVLKYEKIYNNRLDFEDLEQAGFIGLIKAAEKFDIKRDIEFSTYASYWIRQLVIREIMDSGNIIRIPVHVMERLWKVIKVSKSLENEQLLLKDKISKIAELIGITENQVKECLILKNNYIKYTSLNSIVGEDDDTELIEFVAFDEELGTEKIVESIFLRKTLEEIMSDFKKREQDIIKLRFGFENNECHTLEEIGKIYGLSRERIRQIEMKTLKKLKKRKYMERIKEFL